MRHDWYTRRVGDATDMRAAAAHHRAMPRHLITSIVTVLALAPAAVSISTAAAAPNTTSGGAVVCKEGEHKTVTRTDVNGVQHTHTYVCNAHEQWIMQSRVAPAAGDPSMTLLPVMARLA